MCGQVNPEKSLQSQYFLQLHLNWCQSDFPPWTVILFYNDCWGREHWMARTSWLECLDHFVNKRKFYWMYAQTVQCWMLVSLVLVGVNVSMMECYVCLTMCYSGDMNINVTIVGMSWHRYDVMQWWPVVCRVSGSSPGALQWPAGASPSQAAAAIPLLLSAHQQPEEVVIILARCVNMLLQSAHQSLHVQTSASLSSSVPGKDSVVTSAGFVKPSHRDRNGVVPGIHFILICLATVNR